MIFGEERSDRSTWDVETLQVVLESDSNMVKEKLLVVVGNGSNMVN